MKHHNPTQMNTSVTTPGLLLTLSLSALLYGACSDGPGSDNVTPDEPEDREYALFLAAGNSTTGYTQYTLTTGDLMKDTTISALGAGVVADVDLFWAQYYSAYDNGNFYLTIDGNTISKQRIEGGKYVEVGNLVTDEPNWDFAISKSYFTDGRFNFLSYGERYIADKDLKERDMYVIDTAGAMHTESINTFTIPLPEKHYVNADGQEIPREEYWITSTSFMIRDGKVFSGFFYDMGVEIDTAMVLVADYPSLANQKIVKDARLDRVSGAWYAGSSSFMDENGDIYFTTYDKENGDSYGLLRIKKGETEFDPSYAFNLEGYDTKESGYDHHAYLKNGLAYIKNYIVDVRNQKVVADLNSFGLGKEQPSLSPLVEDGKLYVILKTEDDRWFIGCYDPDTNTLTRGLEVDGGVTNVFRICRLK